MKNRLKEFRTDRNMSQAELSEKTGLSRTTINKIERNEEANVNTRTMAKIAEVFDVNPSDIFLI